MIKIGQQDRFKFRVWSKELGQYIHPTQINFEHGVAEYITTGGEYNEVDIKGLHIEQCTGLKDKNGKLIFEGDIVLLTRSRNYGWCKRGTKLQVRWNTFNCCGFGFGAIGNLTEKCAKNCVVIGNIHENPELLEDKER